MSQTLLSLAGFQVILIGRFWVIAEDFRLSQALANQVVRKGVCGDFILCGLSPPVSPRREMVSQYTF